MYTIKEYLMSTDDDYDEEYFDIALLEDTFYL